MRRAAVHQTLYVGVEGGGAPGVAVPAVNRLLGTTFTARPRIPIAEHRPTGSKFITDTSREKEWTEFDYSGDRIAFNDLRYWLATLVEGGALTYKPSAFAPDVRATLTIDQGSSNGAERFTWAHARSIAFRFTRTEASFRGTGTGQKLLEAVTLETVGVTDVPKVVGDPSETDVYIGPTVGGLVDISDDVMEAGFGIGENTSDFFPLGSAKDSYSDVVETEVPLTALLAMEHNARAVTYMNDLRAKTTRFMRIIHTGPEYGVGTPYRIQITFPFRFNESDRGNRDAIHASTFPIIPIYESGFASAYEIIISTNLAAI